MTTKPLPTTAYAVLGLLSGNEEMSGYEVRKSAETLRYFYWRPAQSQIYAELRRLEKMACVTSQMVPQEGKPNKRLYKITATGHTTFRHWLDHAPLEPTNMKHGMQLRLFFGGTADRAQMKALLEQYVAEGEEALGQLAIVQAYAELEPDFGWRAVVAEWSEVRISAEVSFAQELLRRLAAGEI